MNSIAQKNAIRKFMRQKKQQYSFEEKKQLSEKIWKRLEAEPIFQVAKTILCYYSMKDEVHTHNFIQRWFLKKQILLPVIVDSTLHLKLFKGMERMVPGPQFGIPEPVGEEFLNYEAIDLAIIPGVAFDSQNNRLGRGRAFYDQLLRKLTCPTVGVFFSFQEVVQVPVEPHDTRLDRIIHDGS
jgi:5-formyltetrahydrofolate cyclo-ligase